MKEKPITNRKMQAILREIAISHRNAYNNNTETDMLTKHFTSSYQNMIYANELEYVAIILDSTPMKELLIDIPIIIDMKRENLEYEDRRRNFAECLRLQCEIIGLRLATTLIKVELEKNK